MISYELARPSRYEPDSGSIEEDVFAALNSLTRPLGVADRCRATLAAMESLFDARSSWVLLREPKGRRLRLAASRGTVDGSIAAMTVPDDQGLMGRAITRREMLFIPSVDDEADWPEPDPILTAGLRSAVLVPLVYEDTPVGVLALGSSRFSQEHPPTSADIARLEAVATLAAVCIENARLFEDSERDRRRLRQALQQRRQLRQQVASLRQRAARGVQQLLGSSAALEQLLAEIEVVARAESTVLLRGETGTGKELVARAIHERSPRRNGPFVAVNCAALPEALVESQLFGHERGAFTGAVSDRPGKFELADGGTLFLDEVGDLPPDAQSTLLRVLEDRRVERVGSTRSREVDVRVVAATNVDLEQGLVDGRFRPDLYYRLSVFPVQLPALRDRRADIPVLATHFAQQCAEQVDRTFNGFMPEAIDRLVQHDWPGNVRELRNVVERAVLLTTGTVIEASAIQIVELPTVGGSVAGHAEKNVPEPARRPRSATLAETDREAIEQALQATGWRVSGASGAARLLGLKPTTLHSKMKRLGIRRPAARRSPGPGSDA